MMTKVRLIVPPLGATPVGCFCEIRYEFGKVCPHFQRLAFGVMAADVG